MAREKRFCPNCGSSNVNPDFSRTNVLGEMMFDNNKWVCNECDYKGLMPEDSEENESDKEEDTGKDGEIGFDKKSQEKIDGDAGRAYFRYWAYILLPLTVLYIIYLTLI